MNADFRYKLEKGSKKYHCPQCLNKTFVRYIDYEQNCYIPEQYGRCDREGKCKYILNPYLDGYAKSQKATSKISSFKNILLQKETIFFDRKTYSKTLSTERYGQNIFLQHLLQKAPFPFAFDDIMKVAGLYSLGTVIKGYMTGAVTFPFIDMENNIRAVQVKKFDENNKSSGKPTFLHSILKNYYCNKGQQLPQWLTNYFKNEKIISCLFGEILLSKYPHNTIALVEAPKTAIYGALYFGLPKTPSDLIWLAVYNLSSFSYSKLKALQNRNVLVFPDLSRDGSTFKKWTSIASEIEATNQGFNFKFSDFLEKNASKDEREDGLDIADYLITKDWRLFRS